MGGGGCSPFLPPNPRLLLQQAVLAKRPGEVVPGHHASILWWVMSSILQEKSWFCLYLLKVSHQTVLGWLEVVLQYAAKRLISKTESFLQKQHRHPLSPLDTSVLKLMLIVSFWSVVACFTSMDHLLVALKHPLSAWHQLHSFQMLISVKRCCEKTTSM